MIEIWQEYATFQTSQRLADQVRTIIKKGLFSCLEILEIYRKTNNEQDSKTSTNNQEQSNLNESLISENRNTTPNYTEQTPTQEQKINLEKLKRIMNEQKSTLPSLRNIEWRTIKMET